MFVRYWLMRLVQNLQRSNVGACVYLRPKLEQGVFASGLGAFASNFCSVASVLGTEETHLAQD